MVYNDGRWSVTCKVFIDDLTVGVELSADDVEELQYEEESGVPGADGQIPP